MRFFAAFDNAELTKLNDSAISSRFFEEIEECNLLILFFILLKIDLFTIFLFNDCLDLFFADLWLAIEKIAYILVI